MKKVTQQQTKEHNRNLVLNTIINHNSISRAEVARTTGLTRTTVSDNVTELIEEGLVSEVGIGESLGGKSPILLSLVNDSRYLIGLDLTSSRFYGAVVNLRGEIRESVERPITDCKEEAALSQAYEILDRLVVSVFKPVIGIGIGTPGLVNTRGGVVVNAVNLEWNNLPLADLLEKRYHLPVFVLNDSQAAALGEYRYGVRGQLSEENLVVINVGKGIGAGVIIKGQLFQGDGGGAGEIGHVSIVQEGGLPCRCGNLGCLETVASAQAVVRDAQQLAGNSGYNSMLEHAATITFDSVFQAFTMGDPLAVQVVMEAGRYLGLAVGSLVGTLNIAKIVLIGDMTCFGQPWLHTIQETFMKSALSKLAQATQVEIGHLGRNAVVLGASASLLKDYSLLFTR